MMSHSFQDVRKSGDRPTLVEDCGTNLSAKAFPCGTAPRCREGAEMLLGGKFTEPACREAKKPILRIGRTLSRAENGLSTRLWTVRCGSGPGTGGMTLRPVRFGGVDRPLSNASSTEAQTVTLTVFTRRHPRVSSRFVMSTIGTQEDCPIFCHHRPCQSTPRALSFPRFIHNDGRLTRTCISGAELHSIDPTSPAIRTPPRA